MFYLSFGLNKIIIGEVNTSGISKHITKKIDRFGLLYKNSNEVFFNYNLLLKEEFLHRFERELKNEGPFSYTYC